MEDPYQILGVSKNADDDEIKKAYRKLSLRYHPDRSTDPDSTKKFQEINNAYESIKTAELRQQREIQQQNPFAGGMPGGGGPDGFQDINHIFNMMFGGGGNGFPGMGGMPPGIRIFHSGGPNAGMEFTNIFQQMNKPPPIFKNVEITLKQCYDGCSVPVEIDRWVMEGNIRTIQHETVYVNIPAGIEENEFVILQERGNAVNEHLKGDIKIGLRITNDTQFERMGMDLLYRKTISLKEALCGFSFELKHLNDKTLSIHNKSNVNIIHPGYKRVFSQMGMKRNGTIGNLVVELQIKFPEKLNQEQMEILSQVLP